MHGAEDSKIRLKNKCLQEWKYHIIGSILQESVGIKEKGGAYRLNVFVLDVRKRRFFPDIMRKNGFLVESRKGDQFYFARKKDCAFEFYDMENAAAAEAVYVKNMKFFLHKYLNRNVQITRIIQMEGETTCILDGDLCYAVKLIGSYVLVGAGPVEVVSDLVSQILKASYEPHLT